MIALKPLVFLAALPLLLAWFIVCVVAALPLGLAGGLARMFSR